MLKYFSFLAFASSLATANAQHVHNAYCGHHLVIEQLQSKFPAYKTYENEFLREMSKIGKEMRGKRDEETLIIPLIVHVVWKEPAENLHDSLILAQVRILNEDFSRTNPDAQRVRNFFEDVVASPNIQFELKEIKRVKTNANFEIGIFNNALPDNVKKSSQGGSDAVDTDTHLNLWICKIQPITLLGITIAQILGYAYPPAGLDNWPDGQSAPSRELDGVVLDYRMIGDNNPYPIDLGNGIPLKVTGRTATHEIAHYLGLRHIWGDGDDPLGINNSCDVDDFVKDTPNQGSRSNFTCDTTQNTCIDELNDLPDMIENFMDYSSEDCMNSFTQGQVDIMRAVLRTKRNNLISSLTNISVTPDWKIAPNPASNDFTISSSEHSTSNIHYSIIHPSGMLLRTGIARPNEMISVMDLPNGIFIVRISHEDKILTKKLVVHR